MSEQRKLVVWDRPRKGGLTGVAAGHILGCIEGPMNILFAGSGEFGLPTLRALRAAGAKIVHVYSQPDRPAGRGKKLTPTPIAQYAAQEGLPLTRTGSINSEALPAADVLVVIAFGQKIAPHVVNHARLGAVNLHASLLPRYRGAAPINWAMLAGDAVTGNSVIRLAQKMDAGAVLGQSRVEIGELETAGELHDRLALDGAELLPRVLGELAAGRSVEVTQDESAATVAPKLNRELSRLDFTMDAKAICAKIRGLAPWPGCRVRLVEAGGAEVARLTLVRARAVEGTAAVGAIDQAGHVGTGRGLVEVVELQPEGKRPMPLAAFRNGRPWAGLRLEALE